MEEIKRLLNLVTDTGTRSVIQRLCSKLDEEGLHRLVENKRGEGYRWNG